jgi:hypothetical protein
MSAESLLDAWLPGGISGVFAICMDASEFDNMQKLIKSEFPSMQHFKAIDLRNALKQMKILTVYNFQ